jgi:hypothetical protein
MAIDRNEFLARLAAEFPKVVAQIRADESGILHCEVGAFLRATEATMDSGGLWTAEKHFRFVEKLLNDADADLRNALEVSYLEGLALGECTLERHRAAKERMPDSLRRILVGHRSEWR